MVLFTWAKRLTACVCSLTCIITASLPSVSLSPDLYMSIRKSIYIEVSWLCWFPWLILKLEFWLHSCCWCNAVTLYRHVVWQPIAYAILHDLSPTDCSDVLCLNVCKWLLPFTPGVVCSRCAGLCDSTDPQTFCTNTLIQGGLFSAVSPLHGLPYHVSDKSMWYSYNPIPEKREGG